MRLRYFRVQNLPPLGDVAMTFGHEGILGRPGAIHFVVGVNGSGKSRLLQTLAEVFLALEGRTIPLFPVTLAWDMGHSDTDRRTLIFHSPDGRTSRARLMDFGGWLPDFQLQQLVEGNLSGEPVGGMAYQSYSGDSLPGAAGFLPSTVLAYTSGDSRNWESLFATRRRGLEEDFEPTVDSEEFSPRTVALNPRPDNIAEASIGLHVTPEALRLGLIVMAVAQAATEFEPILRRDEDRAAFVKKRDEAAALGQRLRIAGFRGILDTIDYLWPVTLKIRVEEPDNSFPGEAWGELRDLATSRLCEPLMPEDGSFANPRSLFYDLRGVETNKAQVILDALGGTAFLAFKTLHEWHLRGLLNLRDMQLVLRKRGVHNLLLLDSLSDGERVFVGRMALFYLLKDEKDALVLLDEPETHFNDFWKRQMVDIVDDSLGDDPNDVVLTTHSSIALTDAFASEVTVLHNHNGQVSAHAPPIQTFGASPTEILQDVFLAPDSVGQRASEYLDMVLLLTQKPFAVEQWWSGDTDVLPELQTHVEQMYIEREEQTPEPDRLVKRITEVLEALRQISDGNILEATQQLHDKLGSGYYRFEFDNRLDFLKTRTPGQRSEGE